MNFNLGASADKPAAGFNLAAPQTTTAGTSGFQFGTGTDAAQAATSTATGFQLKPTLPSNFSLGGSAPGTSGAQGFSLPATTTAATGFNLGGTATGSTGFNLGGTAGGSTGFNLGGTAGGSTGFNLGGTAGGSTGFNVGGTPGAAATSTTAGFPATSLPSTAAPTFSSGFGVGTPATTTTASTGFTLGGTTTTAASGFSLTSATTTTAATSLTGGLLLGGTTTSTAATTGTTSFAMPLNFGQSIATTTATSTASAPAAGTGTAGTNLNFGQLEETINKWTMDLEEQEKLFMNQATQVNAWDHLLTTNGEKIVQLNEAVEAVKVEQQQLDHELDFILAQQRELEDCLVPLEKELASTAVVDPERQHTYELAETMDTQLKQMSEDLREIIEYLNENNRSQDSSDPLVQIGRILNAHMNSLQWIDQNTVVIQNHLEQVVKLHDSHRRDNERSFHVSYS